MHGAVALSCSFFIGLCSLWLLWRVRVMRRRLRLCEQAEEARLQAVAELTQQAAALALTVVQHRVEIEAELQQLRQDVGRVAERVALADLKTGRRGS